VCNSLSGTFTVNRHFELCQESLETNSIYILDTWAEAYLWFGKKHYAEEEKVAIEIAVVCLQFSHPSHPPLPLFPLLICALHQKGLHQRRNGRPRKEHTHLVVE